MLAAITFSFGVAGAGVSLRAAVAQEAPPSVSPDADRGEAQQSTRPAPADDAGTNPVDASAAADAEAPLDAVMMPHDLSPWGMYLAADWVVKAVMIGLAFASVVTWTVWLAKSLEIWGAKRRLRRGAALIENARTLSDAAGRIEDGHGAVAKLIAAARAEVELSAGATDGAGLKERVLSRLDRIEAGTGRAMTKGTGLLATIGATAPFVGLFGTVWGIMNSFIGIAASQTTNLAVVAPGIAEALLATAMGLVAAIPAVVIYNHFSRQIGAYRAHLADVSATVLRLVSRDLSRSNAAELHRLRDAAE